MLGWATDWKEHVRVELWSYRTTSQFGRPKVIACFAQHFKSFRRGFHDLSFLAEAFSFSSCFA